MNSINSDYLSYIPAVAYGLLGLYALSFTAELSFKAKTTDEQIIVIEESDDEADNRFVDGHDEEINDDNIEKEVVLPAYVEESEPAAVNEIISGAEYISDASDVADDAGYIPVSPAKIRTAEADENSEDVSQKASTVDTDEGDVAQELFEAAQKRDMHNDISDPDVTGSGEEVIIDGEFKKTSCFETLNDADKPKGPIERKAVFLEDDFILSLDSRDSADEAPVFDEDEDISAFILEKTEDLNDDQVAAKEKYNARLDEIDKLIISIQGGEMNDQDVE